MPEITFSCPGCQQTFEAPEEMAGQICECPTCQGQISIPSATIEPSSPPPATEAPAVEAPEPDSPVAAAMADALSAPEQGAANTCTECGSEMEPDAVLCMGCGFHKGLGKKISTDFS